MRHHCTLFAVAGFAAAGSALLGGKSGTLRAVPLALEAAAGVTAAAFLASDFALEVVCCGALQMHEVLPGAVCDWFCAHVPRGLPHLQHNASQIVAANLNVVS